ncbi:hypothetical protein NC652_020402 [Populus alba x Populus x berolinensis]|nr:hypothetical protein NC652_020402 [Populus alba x Populus x berolinensis]
MGVMIQRKTHLLRQRQPAVSFSSFNMQPPNFLIFAELVDFRFPSPAHSPLSLTKPTTTTALPPICLTTGSFHFPSHSQPNRPAPLHSRLQQQLLAGDRPTVKVDLHRWRRFEGKRRPNFTAARSHFLRSGGGHRRRRSKEGTVRLRSSGLRSDEGEDQRRRRRNRV